MEESAFAVVHTRNDKRSCVPQHPSKQSHQASLFSERKANYTCHVPNMTTSSIFDAVKTTKGSRYSWDALIHCALSSDQNRETPRGLPLSKKVRLIEIKQALHDVEAFVPIVQTNADGHREALGFLPAQAYEQAARQGTLFVAVDTSVPDGQYLGHLLFGAHYPHARIYQVFVAAHARGHGIGRNLVEALLELYETKQYLSVIAKVADDLAANQFWGALGFETLATKLGGSARGRTINVRVRQLDTPALFGYRERVSGIPLGEAPPNFTPVFALDLNVFFDVTKRRSRAEFGGTVMSASFNNLVRLMVTEEFTTELRRTSSQTSSDPILEFAMHLPTLPRPAGGINEKIVGELARIVFPLRASEGRLTVQDRSDLIHLAIAAHHSITAFVTAEEALVNAGAAIDQLFGVRVVHVRDLANLLKDVTVVASPLEIGFADADLRLSEVESSHIADIRKLAASVRLPRDLQTLVMAEGIQASTRSCRLGRHGRCLRWLLAATVHVARKPRSSDPCR